MLHKIPLFSQYRNESDLFKCNPVFLCLSQEVKPSALHLQENESFVNAISVIHHVFEGLGRYLSGCTMLNNKERNLHKLTGPSDLHLLMFLTPFLLLLLDFALSQMSHGICHQPTELRLFTCEQR